MAGSSASCFVFSLSYLFLLSGFLERFFFGAPGTSGSKKKTVLFAFSGKQRGKIKERRNEPVWE